MHTTEVIIDGYVYDLSTFSKVHPGSINALNMFSHGTNCIQDLQKDC